MHNNYNSYKFVLHAVMGGFYVRVEWNMQLHSTDHDVEKLVSHNEDAELYRIHQY